VSAIGSTPALDLTIVFDPPPERAREDTQFKLKDTRLLNEPTPMVAPGREYRMFFDSAPERYVWPPSGRWAPIHIWWFPNTPGTPAPCSDPTW